jgi:hypothetical protein
VIDFGWWVAKLLLEIYRREKGHLGALGLAVEDLVSISMVPHCVDATLLSEDTFAEVMLISLTGSQRQKGLPLLDTTL